MRAPGGVEPDTAAALCLLAVARKALAAVEDLPLGSVEVTGTGLIAHMVRKLIRDRAASERGCSGPVEHPRAIVDATGDAGVIVGAARRLANLGTLVLVGEDLGRRTEINLYPDVHLRGLTLIGIAPPLQDATAHIGPADDPLVDSCLDSLGRVSSGARLPPGATWYRLPG